MVQRMNAKTVRFYMPALIDEHEQRIPVAANFWQTVYQEVDAKSYSDRQSRHNGADYVGEHVVARAPAQHYIQVGRIRYRSDWPGTIDTATGKSGALSLAKPTEQVFETAFVVPFGTVNRVAIMGPIRGQIGTRAIEAWLTAVLGLEPMGHSVILVPEIDSQVQAKLDNAVGVSTLSVRVPVGAGLAIPDGGQGGGVVDRALGELVAEAGDALDVTMTLSFGRRGSSSGWRQGLLNAARRLESAAGPDKLDVGLILDNGDGKFKVEHHDLIEDQIVSYARFDVVDDQALEEESVLRGILDAIKDFGSR